MGYFAKSFCAAVVQLRSVKVGNVGMRCAVHVVGFMLLDSRIGPISPAPVTHLNWRLFMSPAAHCTTSLPPKTTLQPTLPIQGTPCVLKKKRHYLSQGTRLQPLNIFIPYLSFSCIHCFSIPKPSRTLQNHLKTFEIGAT